MVAGVRALVLVAALSLTACSFDTAVTLPTLDGGYCSFSFEPINVDPCQLPPSSGDLLLPAPGNSDAKYLLDVDTGTLSGPGLTATLERTTVTQSSGPDIVVIAVDSLAIGESTTLSIEGSAAVAIVSRGSITVNGSIDVGATLENAGPGGEASSVCANGTGADGETQQTSPPFDVESGAGAGGGAFGGDGGSGATIVGSSSAATSDPGVQNGNAELLPLRGGCRGGRGGRGGGAGGRGGGALALVTATSISVGSAGVVTAGGGGGRGGAQRYSGGGGGAAGGAILIEGATVTISGTVAANGGGGGEGTRTSGEGNHGDDGTADGDERATGGSGASSGGNGGLGGAGANIDGGDGLDGSTIGGGGGGGGGSAGRVRLRAVSVTTNGGQISPPPLVTAL